MRTALAIAFCLLTFSPLRAETGLLPRVDYDGGLDAGAARAAMLRGEILPLDKILAIVRKTVPGEIIEIELDLEYGVLIYEMDILSPDGRLFELEVSAATGKILEIEEDDDD